MKIPHAITTIKKIKTHCHATFIQLTTSGPKALLKSIFITDAKNQFHVVVVAGCCSCGGLCSCFSVVCQIFNITRVV